MTAGLSHPCGEMQGDDSTFSAHGGATCFGLIVGKLQYPASTTDIVLISRTWLPFLR